jgi:DNA-binding MarR family transcriptional regulator
MLPLAWHKKRNAVGMSDTAELVINIVKEEEPITIMNIVVIGMEKEIASSATMHGGVKWALANGYIKAQAVEGDNRVRLCYLTSKGQKYLGG